MPANGMTRIAGANPQNAMIDNVMALPVIFHAQTVRANCDIAVPMSEATCPAQTMTKASIPCG